MKVRVFVLFLLLMASKCMYSQNTQELDAYNSYINFLNESVHGLVIAHILLVNNNKDLNKYIDLESTKTVDFGNDDLPSNIFDKPDDDSDFYEISPIELSKICTNKSSALDRSTANSLNSQTKEIVNILNQINRIRFDLEKYMDGHDLNEKESVYGVYEYLENVVVLFDNYSKAHNRLAADIKNAYRKTTDKMYLGFFDIHNSVKDVLHSMRAENEAHTSSYIQSLQLALSSYEEISSSYQGKNHSSNYKELTRTIGEKTQKVINLLEDYQNPGSIPVQHELYGKHYYYHNQLLIHYFNWSGPGFVRDMNALLTELKVPFIQFDEEPLIFKVIYPVKLIEAKALEDKPVIVKRPPPSVPNDLQFSQKKSVVNENSIILEIHDNDILDRDSISISFNGKLILENYLLQGTPKKIILDLAEGGNNSLEIKAVNQGLMPPNTCAVAYRYVGQRKKIKIKSDLQTNETLTLSLD